MGGVYGKLRNTYKILVVKLKECDHIEDLGVDGRIVLKPGFQKQDDRQWTGLK
jgi:hypothetical protein